MRGGAAGATRSDYLRIFGEGAIAGLDEGGLLRRFAERGDEPAFEALVARLGPMVLGVCRRTLGDGPDADDAFQATFLVLVRRARSIRLDEPIAPWLHGVALKVARRARRQSSRRAARERARGVVAEAGREDDRAFDRSELRRQIDEEIDRLPEHHRRAVLLCDVEGLSREEAAARLGWSTNMVRGRLDRARARLRERLSRRGLAPADSWMALIGPPLVPKPLLVAMTVRSALSYAIGRSLIPGPAVALCEGVIRMTMLAQWKLAATALLSAVAVAGTSGILAGQDPAKGQAAPGAAPAQAQVSPGVPVEAGPGSPAPGLNGPARLGALTEPAGVDEKTLGSSVNLGKARVEVARRRLEAQLAFYAEGRITIDRLIAASRVMMDAELDVARTPEAREAPLRLHVGRLREILRREKAELEVGRATTADVAEAEGSLLDAEFLLAKQVEARNRPARADAPPAADPFVPPASGPLPAAAAKLGENRVALAREQFEIVKSLYRNARIEIDRVLEASRAWMEAERDIAGSKPARDEAVRLQIARLRDVAEIARARKESARGTEADVLAVQSNLADAEFLLAREAEGPGPVPRADGPPAADPFAPPGAAPGAPGAGARPESARNLARERVQVARRIRDDQLRLVSGGEASIGDFVDSVRSLLEAELDAAESRAARLDLLAAFVRDCQKLEADIASLASRGEKTSVEVDKARAAVLAARYRLARESEGAEQARSAEAASAAPVPPAAPVAEAGPESDLTVARAQLKVARQGMAVVEEHFKAGDTGVDELLVASKGLMEAELEAAGSRAARLLVLAQFVRRAQHTERAIAELADRKKRTARDVEEAHAAVVEARYRLAKEEGQAAGPARPDVPPGADPQVPAAIPGPPQGAVAELARERAKLARRAWEREEKLFKEGTLSHVEFFAATRLLTEAELDAAPSKADRLDVFRARLRYFQALDAEAHKPTWGEIDPTLFDAIGAVILDVRYRLAKEEGPAAGSDLERRMSTVEAKLDRIIEQLGAKAPK